MSWGKKAIRVEKRTKDSDSDSSSSSEWLVTLSNKTQVSAKIVVIAVGPKDAYSLFHDNERPEVLSKAAKEAKPVRMACLDVALSSLPDKDALFALGVDRPLYFSVHSVYAKLAPEGGALIHVAKFLGTSIKPKPREDQQELEGMLDLLQPGWREVLVKRRPLPNMVVSNALVTAAAGGLAGRPDVKIADDLYIVGDWVGKEGLFSTPSSASAKRAAQLILNVAAVAAKLLLLAENNERSQHENKAYVITGPEALSYNQVTEIISNEIGKKISYIDTEEEDARKAMESMDIEDWLIDSILEEFYNTKMGNRSTTTNTVEQIIGRKPTSFVQFVRDYANSFN